MVLPRGVGLALLLAALGCPRAAWPLVWYSAWVSTVYTEPGTNRTVRSSAESGLYGDASPKQSVQGLVGIPRGGAPGRMEGCAPDVEYEVPAPPARSAGAPFPAWIALVARGGCSLQHKIGHAVRRRAAAVVVYNEPRFGNTTLPASHLGTSHTVVIMVAHPKGMEILEPVQRGIPVKMAISVGRQHKQEFISGQSAAFVAIALITMMIISLAWLIFFYIQRFLHTRSQFGNQRDRKETVKAIGQLQLHIVNRKDKGLDVDAENCAICIENFQPKDTVRVLPCKHVFHRHCIDPWLLDHRTCPMCKLDIIKALGYWGPSDPYYASVTFKGQPKEVLEAVMPGSISDSVSVGSWNIVVQEEERNEMSDLSATSANAPTLNGNGLKEDAGETAALLETYSRNSRHEEHMV
ncbi:E3 ubiquitin-protein ligase RNF149 isoform X2 [Tiliqua scincoides]|uniref:E3 ubiquitin-protein ligase RNF149 isoform X2 n=1 Tax=Tiliqua scincoides TaxID=71010 RepID=UPI0034621527